MRFCLLMVLGIAFPVTSLQDFPLLRLRENAAFKWIALQNFSRSSWNVITDLNLQPAYNISLHLKSQISALLKVAENGQTDAGINATAVHLATKLHLYSKDLKYCVERLDSFNSFLETSSTIKWWFEPNAATKDDLERIKGQLTTSKKLISHLQHEQATIVDESVWQVRRNNLILKLQEEVDTLLAGSQTIPWLVNHQNQADAVTDTIHLLLEWLRQFASDVDDSIELIRKKKIPRPLIPSVKLEKVLGDVKDRSQWEISTDPYEESQVSVVRIDNKFWLFIQIPLFEQNTNQFEVYEIFPFSTPFGDALSYQLPAYVPSSGVTLARRGNFGHLVLLNYLVTGKSNFFDFFYQLCKTPRLT